MTRALAPTDKRLSHCLDAAARVARRQPQLTIGIDA
jgi:hypothetical protein